MSFMKWFTQDNQRQEKDDMTFDDSSNARSNEITFFERIVTICEKYEQKTDKTEDDHIIEMLSAHAENVCTYTDVKFCFIGYIDEDEVLYEGAAGNGKESVQAQQYLHRIENESLSESLTYSLLNKEGNFVQWYKGHESFEDYLRNNLENPNIDRLRKTQDELLGEKEIQRIIIIPIFSEETIVGYIELLDGYSERLSSSQIRALNILSKRLGLYHKRKMKSTPRGIYRRDRRALFKLVDTSNPEDYIHELFEFLKKNFGVKVGMLWTHAEYGMSTESDRVVLRKHFVDPVYKEIQEYLDQRISFPLADTLCGAILSGDTSTIDLQSHKGAVLMPREERMKISPYKIQINKFSHWACLGIKRTKKSELGKYWGVLSLYIDHTGNNYDFRFYNKRLQRITSYINVLTEHLIYKHSYNEIGQFKNKLPKDLNERYDQYLHRVCIYLKSALRADHCTIFLKHPLRDTLILGESSTDQLTDYRKVQQPISLPKDELINEKRDIYDLKKDQCHITNLFNDIQSEAVFVYDIWSDIDNKMIDHRIIEGYKEKQRSEILVPLVDAKKKRFGIVKCTNNQSGVNKSFRPFNQTDKQLLIMIIDHVSIAIQHMNEDQNHERQYANFSHEARSHLFALSFNLPIIEYIMRQRKVVFPDIQKRYNYIKGDFEALRNLIALFDFNIRGIKNISDSEAYSSVSLKELVYNNVRLFERDGITFKYHGLDILISVQKESFSRGLYNVIQNAVRYSTESQKRILIKAYSTIDGLVINVSNYGIPIMRHEVNKIFTQEDYRGVEAINMVTTGSGVGLKFTWKTMQDHGGDIKVTQLDSPTTFSLYLPSDRIIRK